ncbi:MAG: hypothetical protein ACREBS_00555 [Nitrososphaerales archaeon]
MQRDYYSYWGSLGIVSVVFLGLPYSLYIMGVSLLNDFALTMLAAGVLIDVFTTKIGFNRGYGECNIFYNLARKRSKNNAFLFGILISGMVKGTFIFLFWQNTFILMLVALVSLIAPLWNSLILSKREESKIPREKITV